MHAYHVGINYTIYCRFACSCIVFYILCHIYMMHERRNLNTRKYFPLFMLLCIVEMQYACMLNTCVYVVYVVALYCACTVTVVVYYPKCYL